MPKLFRATSKVDNFSYRDRIYDSVEVCWFVVHRDTPPFSSEEVIKELRELGKEVKNLRFMFENNIKELFTYEEACALEEYLFRICKHKCEIKKADLFLESYTLGYGDTLPEFGQGFYRLTRDDRYDLPFLVWGYYDVSCAKDISWLTYGTQFIEIALNKIGVSVTDKDRLRVIIEELKDEGIFVEKGIKRNERESKRKAYVEK